MMTFNYSNIPPGFYDKVLDSHNGLRKFWHWHKFDSVLRTIDNHSHPISVLDVGCFAGTFAGRFLDDKSFHSTSIDILETQVNYAKARYESENKKFYHYHDFTGAEQIFKDVKFDAVTFIEVIEHLEPRQIFSFFQMLTKLTKNSSEIIITTPNYLSVWPILEVLLNLFSDVKYEEQHITKFTTFNIVNKLSKIYPLLLKDYKVSFVTTSHFLSPYISIFNYQFAKYFSKKYRSSDWNNPFGSIVILKLVRN